MKGDEKGDNVTLNSRGHSRAYIIRRAGKGGQNAEKWPGFDASVELGGLLCEARARYPANQRFSNWLDEHEIKISVHDRAALLNLGLDMQAMRVILEQTDRTSYELIWNDVKLQIAK